MPDFQLSYSGEQVNTAIGNGLNAVTTESGQTLTPEQQQVVQKKIGLNQLFSHTAPPIVEDKSGSMVSITDASNQTAVSLVSQIVPIQAGSGDPSPYNVRDISGWDAVEATSTGKNLQSRKNIKPLPYTLNGVTFSDGGNGKIVISGTATATTSLTLINRGTGSRDFLKAGTYTVSGSANQVNATVYYQFYDNQAVSMGEPFLTVQTSSGSPKNTFTLDRDCYYGCYISVGTGKTPSGYTIPQLEVGSTATDYEPYEAETLNTNLPETVYGGTLDWTTGVLTVDTALATFDSSDVIAYGTASTGIPFVQITTPIPTPSGSISGAVSSQYPITASVSTSDAIRITSKNMYIYDERFTDEATAKSLLDAGTPQIVYKIAEPYTIQITPQQLTLLKGTNNVWSNSGDTAISYVADTKMYIDGLVSSIASAVLNN